MKTNLILVGRTVNKHFVAGINDYAERIGHYMPFSITVIPELKKTARKKERIHGENSPGNASAAYPESLEKPSVFERSLPIRGFDFESDHAKTPYLSSNCRLHFPKPIRTLRFFSSEQFSRLHGITAPKIESHILFRQSHIRQKDASLVQ